MKIQQKNIAAPISNFVFKNKRPPYGVYRQRVVDTSTNEWDDQRGWWSARRWQRKAWIFFGAYTAELAVGIALVDAGYLAKAFCYVYQRQNGQYWEHAYSRPWGFGKNFQAALAEPWQLGNYRADFEDGKGSISYQHQNIQLQLSFEDTPNGISALCPSQDQRPFHYTYKNLLLPTQLHVQHPDFEAYTNRPALGSLDHSKGYPPRHTRWNWTSFMGQLDDGTPVGVNTVRGFNDELENALWVGNQVQRLGQMHYHYPSAPLTAPWRMQADDQQLVLELQPDGLRQENIHLGLLKSNFKQVFGTVQGTLYHQEQWRALNGYGLMEDHEALW
jgi:hypothetical protein